MRACFVVLGVVCADLPTVLPGRSLARDALAPKMESPQQGQKAAITHGSFGSYSVSVDDQPGIRMRRVE